MAGGIKTNDPLWAKADLPQDSMGTFVVRDELGASGVGAVGWICLVELYLALGEMDGDTVFKAGLGVDEVDAVAALWVVTTFRREAILAIETHANVVV